MIFVCWKNLHLGFVHKWRHVILDTFWPPSPHRHAFYCYGLCTFLAKSLTSSILPLKTVLSFMAIFIFLKKIILEKFDSWGNRLLTVTKEVTRTGNLLHIYLWNGFIKWTRTHLRKNSTKTVIILAIKHINNQTKCYITAIFSYSAWVKTLRKQSYKINLVFKRLHFS